MKRTCFANESCPIARSLDTVGDWWSLLIVRDAFTGKRRFGEFLKSLGVARNILTARLKKLVADGVLQTVPASDGSAYKEYVLTERGRGLFVVLVALGQWSEGEAGTAEWSLVDRKKGRPVRLELRGEDGRRVALEDVRLVPKEAER
jgi:DNA-binding HxlR family transcriptional regulator